MSSTSFDMQSALGTSNLVDLLRKRAASTPDKVVFTFLPEHERGRDETITFAELDARASALAALLTEHDATNRPVLLLYPSGIDYIVAFFGCLYAGAIAVPAYPPDPMRLERTLPRLQAIADDSGARIVLSSARICRMRELLQPLAPGLSALTWCATDDLPRAPHAHTRSPRPRDLAFLQYTSGSTSTPKGVMVSHQNLMANELMIRHSMRVQPDTVIVGWLPLYHDMGLIGNVLQAVYSGVHAHLMSPPAFVQAPLRWLRRISDARGTASGGPNFAYELCARRANPALLEGLDLSSWTLAFNGAEPVRADTMRRFAEVFAPYGFRSETFFPCYGLAEATLLVTGSHASVSTRSIGGSPVVGSGEPAAGLTLRIVDPATSAPVYPGEVGEIWVHGPNVAQGYWRRDDATRETFQAELAGEPGKAFLRTGDLGAVQEGALYVAGRLKDLIIVAGRNHYPQDLERSAEQAHPSVRASCVAAFAVEGDEEERAVVAFEARARDEQQLQDALTCVRTAIAHEHDLSLYAVVALKPGSIGKTSSGKIQRRATRQAWLDGTLEVLGSWTRGEVAKPALEIGELELTRFLSRELAAALRVPEASIDHRAPLAQYGLDSKTVLSTVGALSTWLGRDVSPSLLYECPTIDAIARKLSRPDAPAQPALEAPQQATFEPIALVGLDCRFPGAADAAQLWRLLRDGVDTVQEVPANRWDAEAHYAPSPTRGKIITKNLAAIADVDLFDPAFFGITTGEARSLDPQHRLLLEVAWNALEDAGHAPSALSGSKTGVFVGMSSNDYAQRELLAGDPSRIDAFAGTGNTHSTAAGRLSYLLGLTGPSLVVDTACSSSLVAVHLACRALQARECDLALAGGVNLILSPESSIYLSMVGALSPDGRSKPFSAQADGYGRGEGCGLVVLKRLSDALAAGDSVLAVVRGSAVNQDGRSNGLTAPNPEAQRAVLREALQVAALAPHELDYVETHGTGTPLGDPIEAEALGDTLGRGRPAERPLVLGSIKANIGHLESAAGVAGLIKAVLALRHGEIPAELYARSPSRAVAWSELGLALPVDTIAWARRADRPRYAGVSSFGMSGTNAHVVLAEAPASEGATSGRALQVLPISARTASGLARRGAQVESSLAEFGTATLTQLCGTWARGRADLPHRAVVIAQTRSELSQGLAALRSEQEHPRTLHGQASAAPRVAFLFTGQGSQYLGMGKQLFASEPVFRAALERCDQVASSLLPRSLLSVMHGDDAALLDATEYTQPALFALQYALCELWRAWGITPALVVGHSVGEFAAAYAAGVLSFEDGLRLTCARGRAIREHCETGAMLAIDASDVGELLRDSAVVVAGFNAPNAISVAGPHPEIEALETRLRAQGVRFTRLDASHGFHSPAMQAAVPAFTRSFEGVRLQAPRVRFLSTLTGSPVEEELTSPAYYLRQLCAPVRFAQAVQDLEARGITALVEIGPHPVLLGLHRRGAPDASLLRQPSLVRDARDDEQMVRALASLYVHGCNVSWAQLAPASRPEAMFLPGYPFERASYWIDVKQASSAAPLAKPVARLPRARIAERLREIVAAVLDLAVDEVGMHTPLVELGADSMVLVEGVQRMQREFAVTVPLREVFLRYPTLDALADFVDAAQGRSALPVSEPTPEPDLAELAQSALTPTQQRFVRAFTESYRARTGGSHQRQLESRPALVDMRASAAVRASFPASVKAQWLHTKEVAYPIVAARSAGSRIWDVDQNEYIDIAMGFGVHLFGHGAPFLADAVRAQLEAGIQIGPQAERAAAVAQLASELTGMERFVFCSSGTEAVMTSLRIARAVTERPKIALFAGSYHGSFDGVLGAIPATLGSPRFLEQDVIVLEYGSDDALATLREHAHELAAVLVEPVQGRRPEHQPRAFLHALRALTRELGALLIFDEVLVGFRIEQGGAQAHFDVRADLVTYGKVLGGGMPIGAVAGSAAVMDAVDGGGWSYGDASTPRVDQIWFAGTFNKNPLAMATAFAALTQLKAVGPALQRDLNERTARMAQELNRWFADQGVALEVVHFGSMFRFKLPRNCELFYFLLLSRGIYVWEGRSCFLSTAHSEEDVAAIVRAVKAATDALREAGFLPSAPRELERVVRLPSGAALLRPKPRPEATLRLFCLPSAGSTASSYGQWAARLPEHVEVCAVELPGRGVAEGGTPIADFEALVRALEQDLLRWCDRPVALYGHSMGALLAFELTRRLSQLHGRDVQALFVSGEPAPQIARPPLPMPLRDVDDDTLLAHLHTLGISLERADRELIDALLPLLRTDLEVCESYRHRAGPPLACAIAAYYGSEDPLASKADVMAWELHTTHSFSVRRIVGDHGFVRSARAVLLQHLRGELGALVPDRISQELPTRELLRELRPTRPNAKHDQTAESP